MLIKKVLPLDDMSYYDSIDSSSICFDIETTGLNKRFSHTTVIGTGFRRDCDIVFRQWLIDEPSSERDALIEFSEYLKNFKSIIQFNGNSFDIPYIAERCKIYGLSDPFFDMPLIDLYKSAKHLVNVSALENFKQKSLEQLFDIQRKDLISGRDCIFAYQDYLRYGDAAARDALLLHNEEDVLGLLKLYSLYHLERLTYKLILNKCEVSDDISFKFTLSLPIPFGISHDEADYSLKIYDYEGTLILHPIACERRLYFDNYKDYYYLPDDDRAIHKSVGIYVDPSHRQKAVKSNCYERINDCFFKQYNSIVHPAFKEEVRDKAYWFRARDLQNASDETKYSMCVSWLNHIFKLK